MKIFLVSVALFFSLLLGIRMYESTHTVIELIEVVTLTPFAIVSWMMVIFR